MSSSAGSSSLDVGRKRRGVGRMNLHALRFAWLEKGCVEFHFLSKRKKLVPLFMLNSGFTGNSLVRESAAPLGAQPGPAAGAGGDLEQSNMTGGCPQAAEMAGGDR